MNALKRYLAIFLTVILCVGGVALGEGEKYWPDGDIFMGLCFFGTPEEVQQRHFMEDDFVVPAEDVRTITSKKLFLADVFQYELTYSWPEASVVCIGLKGQEQSKERIMEQLKSAENLLVEKWGGISEEKWIRGDAIVEPFDYYNQLGNREAFVYVREIVLDDHYNASVRLNNTEEGAIYVSLEFNGLVFKNPSSAQNFDW